VTLLVLEGTNRAEVKTALPLAAEVTILVMGLRERGAGMRAEEVGMEYEAAEMVAEMAAERLVAKPVEDSGAVAARRCCRFQS